MLRTLVIALLAVVPVAGLAPGCSGDNLSTKGQLVTCDPNGNCSPTDNPTPAPGMCTDIDEDGDGEAHDATEAEDGHDSVSDTDDDNDGTPDTADTDDDNDGIPDTADCDELPGGDDADS